MRQLTVLDTIQSIPIKCQNPWSILKVSKSFCLWLSRPQYNKSIAWPNNSGLCYKCHDARFVLLLSSGLMMALNQTEILSLTRQPLPTIWDFFSRNNIKIKRAKPFYLCSEVTNQCIWIRNNISNWEIAVCAAGWSITWLTNLRLAMRSFYPPLSVSASFYWYLNLLEAPWKGKEL